MNQDNKEQVLSVLIAMTELIGTEITLYFSKLPMTVVCHPSVCHIFFLQNSTNEALSMKIQSLV